MMTSELRNWVHTKLEVSLKPIMLAADLYLEIRRHSFLKMLG
jgi:hypothetical protein